MWEMGIRCLDHHPARPQSVCEQAWITLAFHLARMPRRGCEYNRCGTFPRGTWMAIYSPQLEYRSNQSQLGELVSVSALLIGSRVWSHLTKYRWQRQLPCRKIRLRMGDNSDSQHPWSSLYFYAAPAKSLRFLRKQLLLWSSEKEPCESSNILSFWSLVLWISWAFEIPLAFWAHHMSLSSCLVSHWQPRAV